MGQAPTETVQAIYGAFGARDVPAILGMLAPDAVMDFPGPEDYPVFGRRSGLDGAAAFFQAIGETEDIGVFEIHDLRADRDAVLALGHVELTLRKNGEKVAYDFAHVWKVQGGKVASFQGFTDTARIVEAWRK